MKLANRVAVLAGAGGGIGRATALALARRGAAQLPPAPGQHRIVNVFGIYGIISPPGQSAYAASKFAVRGFSNALRHEGDGTTVGVSVAHPGDVGTAIAKNARAPKDAPRHEITRHSWRCSNAPFNSGKS